MVAVLPAWRLQPNLAKPVDVPVSSGVSHGTDSSSPSGRLASGVLPLEAESDDVTLYVALLRGIGPGNPAMRNENLRRVCEELGYGSVQTVISSGNVVFESDIDDRAALEASMELAWPRELGFESTTIVRSRSALASLVDLKPFGDLEHGRETYLLVTFAKHSLEIPFDLPHIPFGQGHEVVAATKTEIFTVTDTTAERTPNVMGWVEDQFGKLVSSRTWLTVSRILGRMG